MNDVKTEQGSCRTLREEDRKSGVLNKNKGEVSKLEAPD